MIDPLVRIAWFGGDGDSGERASQTLGSDVTAVENSQPSRSIRWIVKDAYAPIPVHRVDHQFLTVESYPR